MNVRYIILLFFFFLSSQSCIHQVKGKNIVFITSLFGVETGIEIGFPKAKPQKIENHSKCIKQTIKSW